MIYHFNDFFNVVPVDICTEVSFKMSSHRYTVIGSRGLPSRTILCRAGRNSPINDGYRFAMLQNFSVYVHSAVVHFFSGNCSAYSKSRAISMSWSTQELPGFFYWPTYLSALFPFPWVSMNCFSMNFYSFQKWQMEEFCMALCHQMYIYITGSKSCTSLEPRLWKMALLLNFFLVPAMLTSPEGYLWSNYSLYDTL